MAKTSKGSDRSASTLPPRPMDTLIQSPISSDPKHKISKSKADSLNNAFNNLSSVRKAKEELAKKKK